MLLVIKGLGQILKGRGFYDVERCCDHHRIRGDYTLRSAYHSEIDTVAHRAALVNVLNRVLASKDKTVQLCTARALQNKQGVGRIYLRHTRRGKFRGMCVELLADDSSVNVSFRNK